MNICEWCGEPQAKKRFCNRACSNAWQHANGVRRTYVNDKTTWEWWVKRYGEEEALRRKELQRQTASVAVTGEKNPMYGRHDHTHGLQRTHEFRRGKTWVQLYGAEKATQLRAHYAQVFAGEGNPAYGHVYERGGRSRIQGTYRGIRFKSSYELSWLVDVMAHGERVNVPQSLKYVLNGRKRTYLPDFQVGSTVYEIKPTALVSHPTNVIKFEACRAFCSERGLQFEIVTEQEIKLLTLEQIAVLEDVSWNEGSEEHVKKALQNHRV